MHPDIQLSTNHEHINNGAVKTTSMTVKWHTWIFLLHIFRLYSNDFFKKMCNSF